MKLSHAVEGFILARQADSYSPSTIDLYRWTFKQLVEFSGDPQLESISIDELRQFMASRQDRYAGASLDNLWKSIRAFWGWAHTELSIERVDIHLQRPRYTSAAIQPFTAEEVQHLLQVCNRTVEKHSDRRKSWTQTRPTAKRDRALLLILLDTGLRAGECARLQIQDVNLETGEVFVRPYSTGRKTKSRHVYLGKSARRALWLYWSTRPDRRSDDPVFCVGENKFHDRFSIKKLLDRMGARAGVEKVHPHRFRHTFAIQYLRNGGDVFTLQRLLGHSTLEMVRRYLALASADDQAAHRLASPADRWRL